MDESVKRAILLICDYKKLKEKYPIITEDDLLYLFRRLNPIMEEQELKETVESVCDHAQFSTTEHFGEPSPKLALRYNLVEKIVRNNGECSVCHRKRKTDENYCPACGTKFPYREERLVIRNSDYMLLQDECDELRSEIKKLGCDMQNRWYSELCPNCGHSNERDTSVCEKCGKYLKFDLV